MKRVLLAVCLLPALAWANGGGYISGVESTGAFQPMGIDQVEMLSERLEIDLHMEYADIWIEYVLHNPGKKVKIEAGFPSATWQDEEFGKPQPAKSSNDLKNFWLEADGKKLEVNRVEDDLKVKEPSFYRGNVVNSWHCFKLDFAAGQTRRILVRYRNPYYRRFAHVSDTSSSDGLSLTYLFSSAAAWAGPIRQGTVIVRAISVPKKQVSFNHSERFQPTKEGWLWNFTDFEPTIEDDLVIKTSARYEEFFVYDEGQDVETQLRGFYRGENAEFDVKTNQYSGRWFFIRSDYQVTASSHLAAQGDHEYGPANVKRFDRETAWVEGVPGDGVGESLTLTLEKPARITALAIVNGYTRSEQLYEANGRVEVLEVSVNGHTPFKVEVPDEYLTTESFVVDLPASKELVKSVKLTLAKVRSGSQYQDTAISRIALIQALDKTPKIQPVR